MTERPALLIAGHVNLDRIWELDAPLRAGARLRVRTRRLRLGGGGANTAVALAALGARPLLAGRVSADAAGTAMMNWLADAGVDVSGLEREAGATVPSEILLDSAGERTLLSMSSASTPAPAALEAWQHGCVYMNASRLADPAALMAVCARCLVVAQMPLDPAVSRPAQVLIASRSDIGDRPAASLWHQRAACDPMLRHLVVTDGAAGVEVVDTQGVSTHPQEGQPLQGDSTGAGDFFAAGLLLALSRGLDIAAAVAFSQCAARALLLDRPAPLALWRELPGLS